MSLFTFVFFLNLTYFNNRFLSMEHSFFSRDTPNISTIIPAIDHIDEYLVTASQNVKYSEAIRAALALRKRTLNRYYDKTDHSEVYRIAMGKPLHVHFDSFFFHSSLQFSTLVISYITSRKPDGRMVGSRLHKTLSVPSSTRHMHLWMLMTTSQTLRLLELLCVSLDVPRNVFLTFPSVLVIVLFRKYLR